MTRVVLGSASTGRLRVLRSAGIEPLVTVSAVDEDAVMAEHDGDPPADMVRLLAVAKAEDVATNLPSGVSADCVVIGCDSMLLLEDLLCGKPGNIDAARAQWQSMAGHSGELLTGHAVLRVIGGNVVHKHSETSSTTVYFGTPTTSDLDAYIASAEPLGVAGAFTLDGLGGWFVDRIEGDPSTVIGLSLPLTRTLLARAGISIAQLWATNPA